MSEFNTDNLFKAVEGFENTVKALNEIQTINGQLSDTAKKIESCSEDIKKQTSGISSTVEKITEDNKAILSSLGKCEEKTAQLDKQVQDYMLNTQKSVDELRLQGSNNAREIRDKITETGTQIKTEMELKLSALEKISSDITEIKDNQKKIKTFATVAMIGAIAAAAISVIQLFV